MKVLISNDDGVFAPGLAALVRAFAAAGHEVTVCDEAKGLVAAPMEQLHYDETYAKGVNEAGETTYTLTGCITKDRRQSRDYELLEQGYATMTVLHYDMTHAGATRSLSEQR